MRAQPSGFAGQLSIDDHTWWMMVHAYGVTILTPTKLRRHHWGVPGAKESLECEPGTMRLVLQNRKGFARLALRISTALVALGSSRGVSLRLKM